MSHQDDARNTDAADYLEELEASNCWIEDAQSLMDNRLGHFLNCSNLVRKLVEDERTDELAMAARRTLHSAEMELQAAMADYDLAVQNKLDVLSQSDLDQ